MKNFEWRPEYTVSLLMALFLISMALIVSFDRERYLEKIAELESSVDEIGDLVDSQSFKPQKIEENEDLTSKIRLVSPENNEVITQSPANFEGVVGDNILEIEVTAKVKNEDGESLEEVYVIPKEDIQNGVFYYSSQPQWNNLYEGINFYTFEARFEDGSSQSQSISIIFDPSDEAIEAEVDLVSQVESDLPTSSLKDFEG